MPGGDADAPEDGGAPDGITVRDLTGGERVILGSFAGSSRKAQTRTWVVDTLGTPRTERGMLERRTLNLHADDDPSVRTTVNIPTKRQLARPGDDDPAGGLDDELPPVADLTDLELEDALEASGESGDVDRMTEVAEEMNRRDEANGADDDAQIDRYAALIAAGMGDEEATADAFGVPIERQRRESAIYTLREQGYVGRGFDELARASYQDYVADLQHRAFTDPDVGMALLSERQQRAGIDVDKFFTGPEAYVRKHGSEELLRWFDQNPRMQYPEWRAQLLGDAGAARAAKLDRIGRQDFYR